MDYIFSLNTTEIIISTLKILIEDFLHERRITPKMHYLIHVPSWMLRYLPYTVIRENSPLKFSCKKFAVKYVCYVGNKFLVAWF